MCMCRVLSYIVGKRCLLWPVSSFEKTLLAFFLLHFVLQTQSCLNTPGISWFSTLAFQSSMMKSISLCVLVLNDLTGFPDAQQVKNLPVRQEMQEIWVPSLSLQDPLEEGMASHFSILAWRPRLLWCWMVFLGSEPRSLSFLRLHPSTVFQILLLTMMATLISSSGFFPSVVYIVIIWIKFALSCTF